MKKLNNAGFSMVEVLVSTLLFAMVIATVSSSLMVASRLNGKARRLTEARLAVASAVETIMAEGYDSEAGNYTVRFPNVSVSVTNADLDADNYAELTVTSKTETGVYVNTVVGLAPAEPEAGGGD